MYVLMDKSDGQRGCPNVSRTFYRGRYWVSPLNSLGTREGGRIKVTESVSELQCKESYGTVAT